MTLLVAFGYSTSPVRLAFSHLGLMIVVIGINQASAHSIFTTTKCHLGVMPISSSLIPTATPATHITEFSCFKSNTFHGVWLWSVGFFHIFSLFFQRSSPKIRIPSHGQGWWMRKTAPL
jgi:hypothetical protein